MVGGGQLTPHAPMVATALDDIEDEEYTENESGSASRFVGGEPFGLSDKAGDGRGGGGRT